MKRLGRGSIYYGKREEQSEDIYEEEEQLLKPNPILVTGATGRTGQWIALGLMNQNFNVRCYTRSFSSAEAIFGPSGSNLDIFQGDISSLEDVREAVDNLDAIVCASGAPWWVPGAFSNTDVKGVSNLVAAAKHVPSIRRFVLISTIEDDSRRGVAKREAEKIVMESGIPYVIFRVPKLSSERGGLRRIFLSEEAKPVPGGVGEICRLDLAQCVCQALVHDRIIARLHQEDPDGGFVFPSCIIGVENGADPYVPDKKFWRSQFNRITDSYQEKTNMDQDNDAKRAAKQPDQAS